MIITILILAGMTVALNDVLLLRSLLSPQAIPDLWDDMAIRQCKLALHTGRRSYACVLNVLAHGIYTIFAADPSK
jgi:squalene monooxygenase